MKAKNLKGPDLDFKKWVIEKVQILILIKRLYLEILERFFGELDFLIKRGVDFDLEKSKKGLRAKILILIKVWA